MHKFITPFNTDVKQISHSRGIFCHFQQIVARVAMAANTAAARDGCAFMVALVVLCPSSLAQAKNNDIETAGSATKFALISPH